eukprot:gnl/TRDRNA2_/TRDRNA2_141772_c0_seq1.p1 gnl/TRDRNA2_/TRDRNA2_141772_c0~~gnl/TRDRNA2_/TRDRNA2_141772_c0_seq1.p1  ORF type:complete len:106 (+),score=19.47 gnl/TRDRNA2_/TRDRNA2_141772_c0_seq1:249-566(+)
MPLPRSTGPWEVVPYDIDAREHPGPRWKTMRQVADIYCEELRPLSCGDDRSWKDPETSELRGPWELTVKLSAEKYPEPFVERFCEHLRSVPKELLTEPHRAAAEQ